MKMIQRWDIMILKLLQLLKIKEVEVKLSLPKTRIHQNEVDTGTWTRHFWSEEKQMWVEIFRIKIKLFDEFYMNFKNMGGSCFKTGDVPLPKNSWNESISRNCFGYFLKLYVVSMENIKNKFREIDLLDFTSFFAVCLIFGSRWIFP